jgi:hypothetical protein
MKFLTKLGQIILKGVEIYAGFSPLAQMAFPGQSQTLQVISKDLTEIASIVVTIEGAGQALSLTGTQKLMAATPLVAQAILQSSILVNHTIADPVLFKSGAQKIADGMADVLNSLKDNIDTTNKT